MWCSPEKAARLLSNPSDVGPLEHLVAAHARGELEHLAAADRAPCQGQTAVLLDQGRRRPAAGRHRDAAGPGGADGCCRRGSPARMVSSPWLRCVATIAPYAKAADAKVKLN